MLRYEYLSSISSLLGKNQPGGVCGWDTDPEHYRSWSMRVPHVSLISTCSTLDCSKHVHHIVWLRQTTSGKESWMRVWIHIQLVFLALCSLLSQAIWTTITNLVVLSIGPLLPIFSSLFCPSISLYSPLLSSKVHHGSFHATKWRKSHFNWS